MLTFTFGFAAGAAIAWAIVHFAVVRRVKAELARAEAHLEALGASVGRKL
jgi:hypothetical protein